MVPVLVPISNFFTKFFPLITQYGSIYSLQCKSFLQFFDLVFFNTIPAFFLYFCAKALLIYFLLKLFNKLEVKSHVLYH